MKKSYLFTPAIVLLILGVLLFPSPGPDCQEINRGPEYTFFKGNRFYEEGNFGAAIKEYSKLLNQGRESGAIYYNLGNCYFKKGDLGRSILNYERAKRLIPGDSDLRANHTFALSHVRGAVPEGPRSLVSRISGMFSMLTVNGHTILLSGLYSLMVLFFIAGMFIRAVNRYNRALIPLLLIVTITAAFSFYEKVSLTGREAVIISEDAVARFEPMESGTIHFTLYEGMKIQIMERKKEWTKIKRPDGKVGWILQKNMERI